MSERDPAATKWATIQALRLTGVALAVYGILAANGRAPWPDGLEREFAWILAAVGIMDALVMPVLLARMWSSRNK